MQQDSIAAVEPASLAKGQALETLSSCLRALAANLLRITRGAGNPAEIGPQMIATIDAFEMYRDAVGIYPSSHEISEMLSVRRNSEETGLVSKAASGIEEVIRGSLQVAASRLLGQDLQHARGYTELLLGADMVAKIDLKSG